LHQTLGQELLLFAYLSEFTLGDLAGSLLVPVQYNSTGDRLQRKYGELPILQKKTMYFGSPLTAKPGVTHSWSE